MYYTIKCKNHLEKCTCSLEQAEEFLAESFSDIPAYALSKSSPIAERCSSKDSGTESCLDLRFGTIFELLMPDHGAGVSMSFAEGFRARESVAREKRRGSITPKADYGAKWQEWFAKWDRDSSSWKTRQISLSEEWGSCSVTWPKWGMMQGGACSELTTSAPLTCETGYGYLPTPTASDTTARNIGKSFAITKSGTLRHLNPDGVQSCIRLSQSLKAIALNLLPTPRASVATHGICWKRAESGEHRSQIEEFLASCHLQDGGNRIRGLIVNPEFQDWLMGFPKRWTCSEPLGMDKFRAWLLSHGELFPDSDSQNSQPNSSAP